MTIYSQIPTNDKPCDAKFAGALSPTTTIAFSGSNVGATDEDSPPPDSKPFGFGCHSLPDYWRNTVFYRFTLPAGYTNCRVTLTPTNNKIFSIALTATNVCTTFPGTYYLTTDVCGTTAGQVLVSTRANKCIPVTTFGRDILIVVGSYNDANEGTYNILIQPLAPSYCDSCKNGNETGRDSINGMPYIVSLASQDETCDRTNGKAFSSVNGGYAPYIYYWNTVPSQNDADAVNIKAGTYTLTVTDSTHCSTSATVKVSGIFGPKATLTMTAETCHLQNGTASVSATGGMGNYTYLWSTGSSGQQIYDLKSGKYFVTVSDGGICPAIDSIFIDSIVAPKLSFAVTHASCGDNNGAITVNPAGGSGNYTYSWNTVPQSNSRTIINLSQGSYTVTVSDAGPCKAIGSATINTIGGPSVSFDINDETCGRSNGMLTVNASGGSGNYSFIWNTNPQQTIRTLLDLKAGKYTVTVSDGGPCPAVKSADVKNIEGPTVKLTSVNSTCNKPDGMANAAASGGTGSYSFLWSNGSTSPAITGVKAGKYSVTVSDGGPCPDTASIIIKNTGGPDIKIINVTPATCGNANGAAEVAANGGTGSYTFLWSNGVLQKKNSGLKPGFYYVTVSDGGPCPAIDSCFIDSIKGPEIRFITKEEKCNNQNGMAEVTASGGTGSYTYIWSNGGKQQQINNLKTGVYTVTVNDGGPCPAKGTVNVGHVNGIKLSISKTDAHCNKDDGAAFVTVSNGSGLYSFLWSTSPPKYSAAASSLYSGKYFITVKDTDCTAVDSVTILNIAGPDADFTYTPKELSTLQPLCYFTSSSKGNIVSYYWNFGDGNTTEEINPSHTFPYSDTFYVKLKVTDSYDCTDTVIYPVIVFEDFAVYIPNAFSPDGKGNNETFYPLMTGVDEKRFSMKIFNRWGTNVYSTNDIGKPWNGKFRGSILAGQYVYYIEVYDKKGLWHKYIGKVILLK